MCRELLMFPKDFNAPIFRVNQHKKKALKSFEMLFNVYQQTHHNILENQKLWQHLCENLRPHTSMP
jgi:lipopolysaccharide biosynthesis glycosyltransferase